MNASLQKSNLKNDVPQKETASLTKVWSYMCQEAEEACQKDTLINNFYNKNFLAFKNNSTLGLAAFLIEKLNLKSPTQEAMLKLFKAELLKTDINKNVAIDILAVCERDAACTSVLHGFTFSKGLHALLCHRIAHAVLSKQKDSALYIQYLCCINFSVDIHPAAKIAPGLFLDHGDSIVIGETCVIAEDVSILQDVTLGGTGKDQGDRHPKIGKGVLIGAGAKILGNISIGNHSRIGASSVVLENIPERCTAVGVPARIIPHSQLKEMPSKAMDHNIKNSTS